MSRGRHIVVYRRKRERTTNYRKRLKALLSKRVRLVVRKSSRHIIAQFIAYDEAGDRVLVSAHSGELKKFGWGFDTKNLPAAYLTGLLAGRRAKEAGVSEAILDMGLNTPVRGCRIYAVLAGATGFISIPHSKEVLPSDARLRGKHIAEFASMEKKGNQFSQYNKKGLNIASIGDAFKSVQESVKAEENRKGKKKNG
ncbi:50S ribosomal protein L18 [Candidatus Woesearchaeota archaeon CG08_land_8_20_14_0_20_47_9]|nr:MAG: 50S ribosomal protein L18 [Candidatus Woesearchaeota archaeon CG1_02_47_18]PIN72426.1 MAG: 50S ribosomal protein L18 [Candidatus Woesearchaeota archaeon CG10_big_fil_rev_8_21_14_0_10_47_5]PIO04100.1 MAG: 50S ribosomal protein L18 [Candidatus Woesearchaeota archaeon CG08_land_8_20_14_0_20_47_9]HII29792.1 50S ribosomal protein L18 [Candidatus Woesearchaeota archaeon]